MCYTLTLTIKHLSIRLLYISLYCNVLTNYSTYNNHIATSTTTITTTTVSAAEPYVRWRGGSLCFSLEHRHQQSRSRLFDRQQPRRSWKPQPTVQSLQRQQQQHHQQHRWQQQCFTFVGITTAGTRATQPLSWPRREQHRRGPRPGTRANPN